MEPFIAQIVMFGGNFAPRGWAFCNGQLLSIAQFSALFSLVGTQYGGDGRTTFGLPDLRGRSPMHWGQGPGLSSYSIGQKGGAETVTLTTNELPNHAHTLAYPASTREGQTADPSGHWPAAGEEPTKPYDFDANATLGAATTSSIGANFPHENRSPYQCVSFIIALEGIFPSRS